MGSLLDLTTDLKSLKFGTAPATDRPGGGNSGQPYMKKKIPGTLTEIPGNLTSNEDFLLRGGANAVLDTGVDVLRLGKYFTDLKSPSGFLFTAKQNLLSRVGVATQASSDIDWTNAPLNEGSYTPLSTLAQAGINFTGGHVNKQGIPFASPKTYLNAKTRIVGEPSGEGNRLVDLTDKFINTENLDATLYDYSGGPNSDLGIGRTNILIVPSEQRTGVNSAYLKTKGFFPVPTPPPSPEATINSDPGILGSPNFNFTPEGDDTYTPPPKSGFSVFTKPQVITRKGDILFFNDNTVTNKYASTVGIFNTPKNLKEGLNVSDDAKSFLVGATSVYPSSLPGKPSFTQNGSNRMYDNGSKTWNQDQLAAEPHLNNSSKSTTPDLQDFRKPLLKDAEGESTIMGLAPSYDPKKRRTIDNEEGTSRINMRSPGAKGNVIDYSQGKLSLVTGEPLGAADQINALPIYKSSTVIADPIKNDLVKFRIAAIDNNDPSSKEFIHFRAFIDSFSDSYNANWSSQKYMGRGEPFYKYDSFSRDINLSFTVAAQSREEMMIMYKKLNFLASNLAPDYTDAGYMAGPLMQLTLGGWCYELPGFIKSITLDVPQESPWEIGIPNLDNTEKEFGGIKFRDSKVKEMPMICKVSGFSFTPIHNFRPAKQKNTFQGKGENKTIIKYGDERFVQLDDGGGNNAYNNQRKDPIKIKPRN